MLNRKTQYALRALEYLALQEGKKHVLISDIAAARDIPLKFLENILLELRHEGILLSKKGKGGGYGFRIPAKQIPIARIIRIMDGPIAMLPCASLYYYERCSHCDENNCGLHDLMVSVRDANLRILEHTTLADLAAGKTKKPRLATAKPKAGKAATAKASPRKRS